MEKVLHFAFPRTARGSGAGRVEIYILWEICRGWRALAQDHEGVWGVGKRFYCCCLRHFSSLWYSWNIIGVIFLYSTLLVRNAKIHCLTQGQRCGATSYNHKDGCSTEVLYRWGLIWWINEWMDLWMKWSIDQFTVLIMRVNLAESLTPGNVRQVHFFTMCTVHYTLYSPVGVKFFFPVPDLEKTLTCGKKIQMWRFSWIGNKLNSGKFSPPGRKLKIELCWVAAPGIVMLILWLSGRFTINGNIKEILKRQQKIIGKKQKARSLNGSLLLTDCVV